MVEETDRTSPPPPISSKELLERSGLSRATLNNYVSLGILPKPVVRHPGTGKAPRLGYFPATALHTIDRVNQLKKRGHTMAEIVSMLATENRSPERETRRQEVIDEVLKDPSKLLSRAALKGQPSPVSLQVGNGVPLTLDQIKSPAYLVNYRFELEWANAQAKDKIFGHGAEHSHNITERNLFRLFFQGNRIAGFSGHEELLRFHLSIAKNRVSRSALLGADATGGRDGDVGQLFVWYDEVKGAERQPLLHTEVNLGPVGGTDSWHLLYASFYREGIFFTYAPVSTVNDSLLALLARRDIVIRDLLKKRRPYLTQLAVLVADIQDSVKICTELPPEEYFELINDVWGATEPKLRKYYATHGKHAGDGMVCYFFPQPDCNYALNALRCAQEMRETMRAISRTWQNRKHWVNELRLNIGIHEGQEWFGTYQTPTHLEFTVLGDTINMAGRVSEFAREGAIWATKNLVSKLTSAERATVRYGVRRISTGGEEILVPSTYSRVAGLVDLGNPRFERFLDIGALPITEILDVAAAKKIEPASF